jgi:1,4-alpha-glucan branching enzyme
MDRDLEMPVYLFHQGTAAKAYELMGAHPAVQNGTEGYQFRVWAPNAKRVSVMGDFSQWKSADHPMERLTPQGICSFSYPISRNISSYKYVIEDAHGNIFTKATHTDSIRKRVPHRLKNLQC